MPRCCKLRRQFDDGVAGDVVVEAIVAHHLELIEDADIGVAGAQAVGFVVNLLDVALRAIGLDDLRAVAFDALETLAAHAFRQDDEALAAHPPADPRAADAVIARRGPDKRMDFGIDFAEQFLFEQHRIRRADLVAAGRKFLAVDHDDLGIDAGQRFGQDDVIDLVVRSHAR